MSAEWHRKLGHISYANLRKLQKMCEGIPESIRKCKDYDTCPICMKVKQSRLPFNTKRRKARKPLEIIHSDVCGPIDPTTYENKKYFLACADDHAFL
jgi:hypothetical protein